MTVGRWSDLRCHPSTRTQTVRAIAVLVRRSADGELHMTFRLDGDISRIQLPPMDAPRFATQLWRHTCFEAFVAVEGRPEYHEFNFAPSGEWAVYNFRGYRDGGPVADDDPVASEMMRPNIALRSTESRLELDAIVRLERLSAIDPHAVLRIGLSAVVEASDGFSYWALRHPTDKPDFHNADGFALLLEPPSAE